MNTFFHASPRAFAQGETLLPPSVTGTTPNYTLGRPTTRVYLSSRLDEATEWAAHLAMTLRVPVEQIRIYQVAPVGRVFSKYLPDMELVEHHAASATVLAQVSGPTPEAAAS